MCNSKNCNTCEVPGVVKLKIIGVRKIKMTDDENVQRFRGIAIGCQNKVHGFSGLNGNTCRRMEELLKKYTS